MDNFEIVEVGNTDIAAVDEEFLVNMERVDFDNGRSIIDYGSALLDEMSKVTLGIGQVANNNELVEVPVDINEMIRDLGKFSTSIEKVEKATTKANTKGFSGLIASTVDKLISKKKNGEDAVPTYYAEYNNYCKKVELVQEALEKQINGALLDIQISEATVKNIKPYLGKLKALIDIGLKDKQKYDEEVVEPLRIDAETERTELAKKRYSLAKQKSTLFGRKLLDLQKVLENTQESMLQNELVQMPNQEYVMNATAFVRDVVPALKLNASSTIQIKRAESRIAKYELLVDVTNETLAQSSEQLKDNITRMNILAEEGGIKTSTLMEVKKNIGDAAALIKKGKDQRASLQDRNMELLRGISNDLNEYQKSIQDLIKLETSTELSEPNKTAFGSYSKRI